MSEEFKKKAILTLVAAWVVLWAGLLFLSQRSNDPAWISQQAVDDLTAARAEFCAELHGADGCPKVNDLSRHQTFRTVIYASSHAPALDSVASVLEEKGWVLTDKSDPSRTVFCRGPYSATYELGEERVWVAFASGDAVCLANKAR